MPRLARSKQCPRTSSLPARKRRSPLPRTGYLANPASLISIRHLEVAHAGSRVTFGCSDLSGLARTQVNAVPPAVISEALEGRALSIARQLRSVSSA